MAFYLLSVSYLGSVGAYLYNDYRSIDAKFKYTSEQFSCVGYRNMLCAPPAKYTYVLDQPKISEDDFKQQVLFEIKHPFVGYIFRPTTFPNPTISKIGATMNASTD